MKEIADGFNEYMYDNDMTPFKVFCGTAILIGALFLLGITFSIIL